jgi:hypothetical protein
MGKPEKPGEHFFEGRYHSGSVMEKGDERNKRPKGAFSG